MALQAPINYNISGVVDPAAAFEQGQLFRSQQEERQRKMQEQAAAQARMQEMQEAIKRLPPNATVGQINALIYQYPELEQRFKYQLSTMDKADQDRRFNEAIPVYSALINNKPDIAESILRERADAYRASGREDEAKSAEFYANLIKTDPGTASSSIGLMLSGSAGKEKFAETFGQLGAERRAEETQPSVRRKGTAEATLAELTAKFAPKKFLAELGLLGAQTEQAVAAAGASRAAAAKSQKETADIGTGVIPPADRPAAEGKFRDEYDKRTKNFQDVRDAYGRVQSSNESAAGDLALIFNYMKMLDPGSAVREGEFATAQNAGSVPTRMISLYNKLLSGERLTADQRIMFRNQAQSLFNRAKADEQVVRNGITRIATGYGLNPSNIFYEAPPPPTAPGTPPATPPAAAPATAPGLAAAAAAELARRRANAGAP